EAIEAAGGTCVALTNEDGGPLGAITSGVASLHVADVAPFLTGTARYSATVLALMFLLDGALGGQVPGFDGRVSDFLALALPVLLAEASRRTQAIAATLAGEGLSGIRVLGAGSDWGTAEYGAAKLVKLYDGPVWGAEIEEYAHSQFWSANARELVVLLASSAETAQLAENTASALHEVGMRTVSVETGGHAVGSATHRIQLPVVPVELAPVAQAIPLQLLAYHLAIALGGNPNMSQDKGDPARFLAAQLLSRHCELAPAS
ncbi:SIS domain-containing protein, partial [Acetobacteraceae bacterium]|nr:SIS domain-containing protein [Acetobacteraceae bacterium]